MFEQLYHRHIPKQNCIKIDENVCLLGKPVNSTLSELEMYTINVCCNDVSDYVIYSRALVHDIAIHSCSWNNKNQNSAIAYYNKDHNKIEYGIVKKIVLLNTNAIILLIAPLKPHGCPLTINRQRISHIGTCIPPSDVDLIALEVHDICSPCVYMSFTDIANKIYVSVLANVLEKD